MKQIINKEDKAVSPIIATILLIAITVVLAATLYTVLGGFTSGLPSGSPKAAATFTEVNPGNYSIAFNSVSGNASMSSLVLLISNGTVGTASVSLAGGYTGGSVSKLYATIGTGTGDQYTVNVTGAYGGYLSVSTTITIAGNNLSMKPTNGFPTHNTNIVTSISIKDTSTSSVLIGNTSPAPSIIVAPATFRID